MKKASHIFFALCFMLTSSCQTNEESVAQKAIDRYIVFVDSVNKADFEKRKGRWDFIELEHTRKRNNAEAALKVFRGKARERESKRIAERDDKYKGLKAAIEY